MRNDPLSHGLWEKTAPPPPQTTVLEGHATAEIAIVGGGYTGLSAALFLAEAGKNVVLLEAEEIGFGGSGRNVGLVNAGMWVMPDDLPGILGETYGERLLRILGDAPSLVFDLAERHGMDCEAMPVGTLHCAVGDSGLRQLDQRAKQWKARGAPVRLLDRQETMAKVGTAAFSGALLDERAGTIQPLAYARGLAHAAARAGADLRTGSRVIRAERSGEDWRLETPKGSVTARNVIVATNAYTSTPWPQIREEIVHLPYFNFATPPLPQAIRDKILPERQGAWDTKQVLTSFRWDREGRLVFGSVGALEGTGRTVHRAWAERAIARLFPDLKGTRFEACWFGHIGMTADHLPKLHRLDAGVWGFSGYNGRGIGPGTVFGKALADLLLGRVGEEEMPLPVTDASTRSFRGLRESVYRLGSQAVHLMRTIV